MLLSREAILWHLDNGSIVIDPFNEKNLKTTSYDVSLGEWFWRESKPKEGIVPVHNVYDEHSTSSVWGGPFVAESASHYVNRENIELKNIKPEDKVILLSPGETILAHTEQFIGGREIVVAKMYARSSMGRNFIEVCKDAGWGDVGYFNRWTMEITNNSQHYAIPLVIGRRVAQIVFYEVAPLKAAEEQYSAENGKYQDTADLAELKLNWNPYMMLPKMHLDFEVDA
ncbi:MAG: hypothetical protein Q8L47_03775 [bacterium]|nr:hypothetical protein [bacterium]